MSVKQNHSQQQPPYKEEQLDRQKFIFLAILFLILLISALYWGLL